MIRNLLVQDLPPELRSLGELPADWQPAILCSRQDVFAALRSVGLEFDRHHQERLRIELGPGRFLELILGAEELLSSFELRIGESAQEAHVAAALLERLGFRALDPTSPNGLFRPSSEQSRAS